MNAEIKRDAAMGRDDTLAAIEDLMARFQTGEVRCAALRLFKADGSWQDIALGGTETERATALKQLKDQFGGNSE